MISPNIQAHLVPSSIGTIRAGLQRTVTKLARTMRPAIARFRPFVNESTDRLESIDPAVNRVDPTRTLSLVVQTSPTPPELGSLCSTHADGRVTAAPSDLIITMYLVLQKQKPHVTLPKMRDRQEETPKTTIGKGAAGPPLPFIGRISIHHQSRLGIFSVSKAIVSISNHQIFLFFSPLDLKITSGR